MQNKTLPFNQLTAISPLDGRYRKNVEELAFYTSEYSLIKTRIEVEAKYLIALSEIRIVRELTNEEIKSLSEFGEKLSFEDIEYVKELETQTRHDVKAMERVFREKLKGTSLEDLTEKIHFGLTSEDINNLSYRLILKRATKTIIIPILNNLINELLDRAEKFKATPMLGRTHGQPAIPTTIGKEIVIFAKRLNDQVRKLENFKLTGKLNGAIGNFNALNFTYPKQDWISFSEKFVASLELIPNLFTTQINVYDDIVEYSQIYQRVNSIIINFNQDIWRYISDNWFVQEAKKGEVGSSTMPQKVNPIDFENSEGNLGLANSIFEFFARKLPISRLQRDLSDSTVIRNIGTALGYSLMGYKSLLTGLSRIKPNLEQISKDLNKDFSILTEAVQTLLRKNGVLDPYSLIASLSRGEHIGEEKWKAWITDLPINKEDKLILENLNPTSYIGLAVELTEKAVKQIRNN